MMIQSELFQKISPFPSASTETLQQLSKITKRCFYKKNMIIFDYHQSQKTFLHIISGWIKLFKESSDGEELVIDVLTSNQHCGEVFLFNPGKEDRYMVRSISDVEILTFPIVSMRELIDIDHGLVLNFLKMILKKQQELNEHIEQLSIKNAAQRIGCFLLRLCKNPEIQQNIILKLPFDKGLLASHLGMKPETFSRALGKLRKECDTHVHNNIVEIYKIKKLTQYVCQNCSKVFPCNLIK